MFYFCFGCQLGLLDPAGLGPAAMPGGPAAVPSRVAEPMQGAVWEAAGGQASAGEKAGEPGQGRSCPGFSAHQARSARTQVQWNARGLPGKYSGTLTSAFKQILLYARDSDIYADPHTMKDKKHPLRSRVP